MGGEGSIEPGAKWRTAVLLCVACLVEGADMAVLPAVYLFVSRSLNASPSDLGIITLCRAMFQALSSPLSGIFGDQLDRTAVIAAGASIWAVCTFGVSMATSVTQACVFSSANGVGLALVIPCAQSMMADYFASDQRGRAFGAMQLTMSVGSMLGSVFATNVAARTVWHVDGWRFAMRTTSVISLVIAALTRAFAVDPHHRRKTAPSDALLAKAGLEEPDDDDGAAAGLSDRGTEKHALLAGQQHSSSSSAGARSEAASGHGRRDSAMRAAARVWRDLRDISVLPTFRIVILQGIVGTMPWNAIAFLTIWLQLRGFTDWQSSLLSAMFYGSTSAGAYLGGSIGDIAARSAPASGRIVTAQFSVFSGIPLSYVLFTCIPPGPTHVHFAVFLAVICVMGLTISWCSSACNAPLFAEIVPPNKRALIYAFDRCFEGALAACAAPLVGVVAEQVFGYDATLETRRAAAHFDPEALAANADALGRSLLYSLCVPWALCFLFYFGALRSQMQGRVPRLDRPVDSRAGLHRTYPADRARMKRKREGRAGAGASPRRDSKV